MVVIPSLISTDLAVVRTYALSLMVALGLRGWSFGYNRRKTSLGLCRYGIKAIELSVYFVRHNPPEEIRETLLHELAHALVGPGHGHDAIWQAKAVELGAKPQRCGQAEMPEGRWQARCGQCGTTFRRHRRPGKLLGWYCRRCGREAGGLRWQWR